MSSEADNTGQFGGEDPDKTRMISRGKKSSQGSDQIIPSKEIPLAGEDPFVGRGGDDDATRIMANTGSDDNDATRLMDSSEGVDSGQTAKMSGDPEKTKLVSRGSKRVESGGPGSSADDPVTGWLVVVDGPGRGRAISVGEQDNRIGRGGGSPAPRVILNFGDQGVSRTNAFIVRYDPKKRRFKVLPGEGTNIVYLNGDDLDSPSTLKTGDMIEVSETTLRFVGFCEESFDWGVTVSDETESA